VLGPGLSTDLGERRLRRVGSGLLVVFLHDNVAQLGYLPWQLDLQNLRFTAFVCSLGLITARRFFTNQRELVIVEHEMNTAREIQSAILPERPPASSGLVVAVRYAPMRTVAGDFYDFVAVDDRGLGMLVADVTGHRVPAAMIASMSKVAFSAQDRASSLPRRSHPVPQPPRASVRDRELRLSGADDGETVIQWRWPPTTAPLARRLS